MLTYEQQPHRGRDVRAAWLTHVTDLLLEQGVDVYGQQAPLWQWLEHHRQPAERLVLAGGRRRLVLAPGHQHRAGADGSVAQRSCLPWQLGHDAGLL